jgi:two-component system, OmpR family, response regulator ChvI
LVKEVNARRRILLIDDEPDVTLTLKTVLENNGYTVDVFNDPIIALRNFKKALEDTANEKKHPYGLVLTDIRMPNMNGFDLYEKIRELDKDIKVRFLTASEINHDEFKEKVAPTIDDTQNCIIEKPVDNQKLLNVVSKLMK